MKKITDFIVEKRNVFLCIFILLAGLSLYLSTFVNINEDIMAYLPSSSETKKGNDIMSEAFSKEDTSTLNVMFKNLSEDEKEETRDKLKKIDGVITVDYDNTEDYNIDEYSLFTLNVDDYADSEKAEQIYNEIKENFDAVGISGIIYDANKPVLQTYIVVIAIVCAMIILIILSESYTEPFLYLITIGIAVFINKGTNIIFANVSSITDSITAILQLALSMDYSIMLSNRFKQEREKTKDKVKAMKNALYESFKAISSSSVTTIVGLLALVFMSFTLGRDLGLVLSKGVLLSLISIFVCLPALLLLCDNLIAKTHKKSPHFNLTKLGEYSYKTRIVQVIIIIVLFIGAYLIQGNTTILYTDSEQDKVGKIFPATNQIAIVYDNKYEELVTSYCEKLNNNPKIDQVLCYSNTINEKLSYDKLNEKLESLGQKTDIDESLIKIIYYNFYQKDTKAMTLDSFISFIKSDIYSNERFSTFVSKELKSNIELLTNFASPSKINKARNINEIAAILGMKKSDASNILVYYNSKNIDTKITLKNFVDFMLNDVASNPGYASSLDDATIGSLKELQYFTNTSLISKKMNAKELSNLLGIDETLVDQLLLVYQMTAGTTDALLTPLELTSFILKTKDNELFMNKLDAASIGKLTLVNKVMESTLKNSYLTAPEISNLFKIDLDTLKLLLGLYSYTYENQSISLNKYINFIVQDVMSNKAYASKFDKATKAKLTLVNSIMKNSLNKKKYSEKELYDTLKGLSNSLDLSLIEMVYLYNSSTNHFDASWQMTVEEFVSYINSDILTNSKFKDFIDDDMKETIVNAKKEINNSKGLIVSDKYSRVVLNTKYAFEGEETTEFISTLEKDLGEKDGIYIVGNSSMAVEMSRTFDGELNKITLLTMIFIFVVVAITFKSLIIPLVLVLVIQCAVYITMSFISLMGGSVYFIALLIVQAILMGATIDYAIVYTSYYKESRLTMNVKEAIINAYNKSIHTIISSSSILIIVTLIVANFASAIAAKICETISEGAVASLVLILFVLPGVLASCDKLICRKK